MANNGEFWRISARGAAVAGNLQKSPIFSSSERSAAPGQWASLTGLVGRLIGGMR
jgi:hypothetical protein